MKTNLIIVVSVVMVSLLVGSTLYYYRDIIFVVKPLNPNPVLENIDPSTELLHFPKYKLTSLTGEIFRITESGDVVVQTANYFSGQTLQLMSTPNMGMRIKYDIKYVASVNGEMIRIGDAHVNREVSTNAPLGGNNYYATPQGGSWNWAGGHGQPQSIKTGEVLSGELGGIYTMWDSDDTNSYRYDRISMIMGFNVDPWDTVPVIYPVTVFNPTRYDDSPSIIDPRILNFGWSDDIGQNYGYAGMGKTTKWLIYELCNNGNVQTTFSVVLEAHDWYTYANVEGVYVNIGNYPTQVTLSPGEVQRYYVKIDVIGKLGDLAILEMCLYYQGKVHTTQSDLRRAFVLYFKGTYSESPEPTWWKGTYSLSDLVTNP